MSLTSYRAAPPRVNFNRGPHNRGAGTYSRFNGDVKGSTAVGRRPPLYGHSPAVCELFVDACRLVGWNGIAAEPVGKPKDEMVRPHIRLERPPALHVGIVAREAELIVPERRDARRD